MRIIGILTQDFRIYYELIKGLKQRDLPFASLSFDEPIPMNIGVIITSKGEEDKIDFPKLVIAEKDIDITIDIARRTLKGKEVFNKLIIGIDPGKRPGLAVIGDGEILSTAQVSSPEKVKEAVGRAIKSYPSDETVIRIGHGDTTHRNRIINSLSKLKLKIEISDETRTTRISETPDIDAAIEIALKSGVEAKGKFKVKPTQGELRDIQRRSRIESRGRVTISKDEAKKVATGELTLEEALKRAEKKNA
ncbi:MAG: hypothetical protein A7315_02640 [Candidatus Altiarchaeales archaeon WOR_SM1_79]|nr:MAG: hypothetical protein A7315_02640 [Candidatus Altiarchaeales archaeon WOR_SM1_79]